MQLQQKFKIEIDTKKKTVRFWKETTQEEYLKSFNLSKDLKKDISLLISKCKNIP